MGAMKQWSMDLRERRGPFQATSGKPLSWADINELTDGGIGTFTFPCPYCGPRIFSSRRFRIDRPSLGFAKWHCFYCGESGELRDDSIDAGREAEARALAGQRQIEKTTRALALWDEAVPIAGTPVIDYLAARGIRDLPPDVDETLRYHPRCPFGSTRQRVMLGLFRDVRSDAPVAVQRTAINPDGAAERMTLGPNARAAIKLWPREGKTLTIGEGIETTLAAALYWKGRPLKPAWAVTVANNILYFPILNWVRRLIILVDNDESGTGQHAANVCAQRWSRLGREVILLQPKHVKDFNDLIKG